MNDAEKIELLREACKAGFDELNHYGWWHDTQDKMRHALAVTDSIGQAIEAPKPPPPNVVQAVTKALDQAVEAKAAPLKVGDNVLVKTKVLSITGEWLTTTCGTVHVTAVQKIELPPLIRKPISLQNIPLNEQAAAKIAKAIDDKEAN